MYRIRNTARKHLRLTGYPETHVGTRDPPAKAVGLQSGDPCGCMSATKAYSPVKAL